MTPPLVSIFLPTFNHAEFVEQAILSALEQDYPHTQIVVGDDGSTDGTAEIVKRLADAAPDRMTAIVEEPHLGLVGNFNRILGACRGELLAFLSGDDVYLPGKISAQVAVMAAHPRIALCHHDVELFDSDTGRLMSRWQEGKARPGLRDESLVKNGNIFHPLGTMIRSAVVPAGGFDGRLPVSNDWKFFVDCCQGRANFHFMDGVWARYRIWSGNVSKREREMYRDLLASLDLMEADYPWLAAACQFRRATLKYVLGLSALRRGDTHGARGHLLASLRTRLTSWRVPVAFGISLLPGKVASRLGSLGQDADEVLLSASEEEA